MQFPYSRHRRIALLLGLVLLAGNVHAASLSVTSNAPLADSYSLEVQYDDAFPAFLQQDLDQSGIRIRFLANFDSLQAARAPGTTVLLANADDGSAYRFNIHPASSIFGDGMDNTNPRYYPSLFAAGPHSFDFLIDPADGSVRLSVDDVLVRSDIGIVNPGIRITRLRFGYPRLSQSTGTALFDDVIVSEPGSMMITLDDDFESGDTTYWDAAIP